MDVQTIVSHLKAKRNQVTRELKLIDRAIDMVLALNGNGSDAKRGQISEAGRLAISKAQKARWAKMRIALAHKGNARKATS